MVSTAESAPPGTPLTTADENHLNSLEDENDSLKIGVGVGVGNGYQKRF